MTVSKFMSKAFFYRDLRRGGGVPYPQGMIRQKYPRADRVKAQGLYPDKGLFWGAYIRVGLYLGGLTSGMDLLLELK